MIGIGALAGARVGIGTGAWIAPRLAGRLFGAGPSASPQLPYVVRLFAVRDVALGLGLGLSGADSRRLWLQAGIACDLADAVAGVLAGRAGQLSPLGAVLVTAPALLGVKFGTDALRCAPAAARG